MPFLGKYLFHGFFLILLIMLLYIFYFFKSLRELSISFILPQSRTNYLSRNNMLRPSSIKPHLILFAKQFKKIVILDNNLLWVNKTDSTV